MARTTTEQARSEADRGEAVQVPEVMDDEAVKSLTVEQIKALTIYQLVGLDGRHDLLAADQSQAVAETLQDRMKSQVKDLNRQAKEKARIEQTRALTEYLRDLAPQMIETAEAGIRKRVEYMSLRVYQDENGNITYKESVKSRKFREGETFFKNSQDGSAQAAD